MLIGSRIKELCAERKISVAKIERMAGVPEKSISKWDKNVPSFDKVQRVLEALEISYEEFANIGSPETQKIQTALVKIRAASPAVYDSIMKKWLEMDEKIMPVTDGNEHSYSIENAVISASDSQKELIQEVLRLPEQQVSAFLSLAKSLPDSPAIQDGTK